MFSGGNWASQYADLQTRGDKKNIIAFYHQILCMLLHLFIMWKECKVIGSINKQNVENVVLEEYSRFFYFLLRTWAWNSCCKHVKYDSLCTQIKKLWGSTISHKVLLCSKIKSKITDVICIICLLLQVCCLLPT